MSGDPCLTVSGALSTITSLEELEGYTAAIHDPNLDTVTPTPEEWRRIADMKIQFQKRRRK